MGGGGGQQSTETSESSRKESGVWGLCVVGLGKRTNDGGAPAAVAYVFYGKVA